MNPYEVTDQGFYGPYGGAYIPEILRQCVEELRIGYRKIIDSDDFKAEYHHLLQTYVGRPSPLYRSEALSRLHGCTVYLKREDLNHTGAHKINNAIGQVLLARRMGKRRIVAETGAGQHGVATATVCALFGLPCTVYMGALDVQRQHTNVEKMRLLGAEVVAVESGNRTLKDACNEALRDWCCHPSDTFYLIGSTMGPHPYPDLVGRLQSVISAEIRSQLQEAEGRSSPDWLVACIGGGSNAAGTVWNYLQDDSVQIVYAEAGGKGIHSGQTAATLTVGREGILHGFRSLVMQDDDGQIIEPYSISAGLDYPGIGPLHAHLVKSGRARALAISDVEALAAAYELNRCDGILPALESAHALAALHHLSFSSTDVVVVTLSGRGDKDLETYLLHAPQQPMPDTFDEILRCVR